MERISEVVDKNRKALLIGLTALAVGAGAYYLSKQTQMKPKLSSAHEEESKSASQKISTINGFVDPKYGGDIVPLTKDEATIRSGIVSEVKYTVILSLLKGDRFHGIARISFELRDPVDGLFLDFNGEKINQATANEIPVKEHGFFAGQRVHLGKKYLKRGKNLVEIAFETKYVRNGAGLHHFVDPEDNEEYLYSQFEAFNAHLVFPCFDQPDIKAEFKFIALAESRWEVISNEQPEFVSGADEAISKKLMENNRIPEDMLTEFSNPPKLHIFRETQKISTYLYAIIAGPYACFNNPSREGYVPMRIFCRKSLERYVDHEEFFHITMSGMDYFKDFFGIAYPFTKYDQIFCPEYNWGAMENVGAVTYNEMYVFRDKPSESKKTRFAITVLHELAHMWFGNLVTMKWWSDLWLNESFATFMSHLAMDKAKGMDNYRTSWLNFLGDKAWGYQTDSLITTHPIATHCKHTEDAQNIFDGISYAKGSSVLKQMCHLIGEDVLSHGMKKYFKTFQWQNTELKDFISTLDDSCKQFEKTKDINLAEWSDVWLKTSGLNIIEPIIEEDGGVVNNFYIKQHPAVHGDKNLRMQIIDIALYDRTLKETIIAGVKLQDKILTEVPQLKAQFTPAAIYLNANDHGYVKVLIDQKSFEFFEQNIEKIKDDLNRSMIWRSLWDMVRDRKLPATRYLRIVKNKLAFEKVQETKSSVLQNSALAVARYLPFDLRTKYAKELFEFILNELLAKELDEKTRILLLDSLLGFLDDSEHIKLAVEWLEKGVFRLDNGKAEPIESAKLSMNNRYSIIKAAFRDDKLEKSTKEILLQSQLEKDRSDIGVIAKLAAEAALPDANSKEKLWNWYLDRKNNKESMKKIGSSMSLFHNYKKPEMMEPYVNKYFEELENVFYNNDREFADIFFHYLSPGYLARDDIIKRMKELLPKVKEDKTHFRQALSDEIENMEIWKEARELCRKEEGAKL